MAYRTFGELADQVKAETDIDEEEFVQPEELIGYFNSAVTIIESEIVKLGCKEKYLQSEAFISITAGEQDYDLPEDIIEQKIRKIIYVNNPDVYELGLAKQESSYEVEDVSRLYSSTDRYAYQIYKIGEDHKLRISPPAYLTVTNALRVIYFKDLNRYEDDNTNADMPWVCYEVLLAYVRYRIYAKESAASPDAQNEKAILDAMIDLMRQTLQNQIADPNNDLNDQDTSFYEEMS